MAEIGDVLTREVGPLPVWGWGVAVVGGLGVGYVVQRSFQSATTGGGGGDGGDQGAVDPGGPTGDLSGTQGSVGLPGGPAQRDEPSGPTTNRQWRSFSLTWAMDNGHDPVDVETALGRYLAGQRVTETGAGIIRGVLRHVGRPPEGAPTLKTGRGDGSGDDSTDPDPDPEPPSTPDPPPGGGQPDRGRRPEPPQPPPDPEPEPSTRWLRVKYRDPDSGHVNRRNVNLTAVGRSKSWYMRRFRRRGWDILDHDTVTLPPGSTGGPDFI